MGQLLCEDKTCSPPWGGRQAPRVKWFLSDKPGLDCGPLVDPLLLFELHTKPPKPRTSPTQSCGSAEFARTKLEDPPGTAHRPYGPKSFSGQRRACTVGIWPTLPTFFAALKATQKRVASTQRRLTALRGWGGACHTLCWLKKGAFSWSALPNPDLVLFWARPGLPRTKDVARRPKCLRQKFC